MWIINIEFKKIFSLPVKILFILCIIAGVGIAMDKSVDEGVDQLDYLLPVFSVHTSKPVVALSFDIHWGDKRVKKILDILEREKVSSTFFPLGSWVRDNQELAREIVAQGHEMGMQGYEHIHLSETSKPRIQEQLEKSYQIIKKVTDTSPILFHPTCGAMNSKVIKLSSDFGLRTITWSIDTLSWKINRESELRKKLKKEVFSGAIILVPADERTSMPVCYLEEIIHTLRESGYEMVTVSELFRNQ